MIESKWLVTADWHFTNKNSKFRFNSEGVSDLLIAQYQFVEELAELLDRGDYDGLIMAGDGTDYATLDPVTATYLYKAIGRLIGTGKHILLLEGNHCILDGAAVHTVVGAISPLTSGKCYCVTSSELIEIEELGLRLWCEPYRSDYKEIEGRVNSINSSLDALWHNALVFHFPTTNAVLDNGVNSENGVNLSKEITDAFTVCLGGDFHRPQTLVGNEKAHYVGAPFDLKFNQEGHRGAVSVHFKSDGSYSMERIDNKLNFRIVTMPSREAVELIQSGQDLSRFIVKVSDVPEEDERDIIEAARSGFYSLSVPSVRKFKKKKADSISSIESFSKDRDLSVFAVSIGAAEASEDVKNRALEIIKKCIGEL
jgi:DNA repair exonuclease SbcCD nuclease subunit